MTQFLGPANPLHSDKSGEAIEQHTHQACAARRTRFLHIPLTPLNPERQSVRDSAPASKPERRSHRACGAHRAQCAASTEQAGRALNPRAIGNTSPMTSDRRDELAEVRSRLRETWPSLTDADVEALPRSRKEAAPGLQQHTGASLDEIETSLCELSGLTPERHQIPESDES